VHRAGFLSSALNLVARSHDYSNKTTPTPESLTAMRRNTLILIAALAVQIAIAMPAFAGACYDGIGCASTQYFPTSEVKQLSCQNLWYVRNRIYKDAGYCFKTATGISEMGNSGCHINAQAAVPLNAYERANVGVIKSAEVAKGCNYGW